MNSSNNIAALQKLSALVDFSNLINSNLELDFTLNNLLLTCFGKLFTTKGLIGLFNDEGKLEIKKSKGLPPSVSQEFPEVTIHDYKDNADFKKFKEKYKFVICKEIVSSNETRGLLILGERLTKAEYDQDSIEFLNTMVNIASTAIENALMVDKLKTVNRDLDGKVNQLSSLFDLSKEFSSILELNMVSKLLVYSIIGQLLVSKYAVVILEDNQLNILESNINLSKLKAALKTCTPASLSIPISREDFKGEHSDIADLEIELIVPMILKGETKGIVLLGKKKTKQSYSKSDIEFVSSIGSLAMISIENSRLVQDAIEKQRLEKDLEIARNIQKNLLPRKTPVSEIFQIAAYNQSARQVGGDYYDIVRIDKDRIVFAIADVSGKGVQAALLMANLQAFLKSILLQNYALDEASNMINDLVSSNTTDGSFITFFWGQLNEKTKELTYVNAGHNPPLLCRKGQITKLKKGGMILGVMETVIPYESEIVKLQSKDAIVLFTDGITEAMDKQSNEYSDERLEALVLQHFEEDTKSLLDRIVNNVKEFTTGAVQSDDITSMVIKVD